MACVCCCKLWLDLEQLSFANSSAEIEHYPTPKDRLVKGNPQQNNRLHFSVEENFFAGEWGSDIGCWKINYTENELLNPYNH